MKKGILITAALIVFFFSLYSQNMEIKKISVSINLDSLIVSLNEQVDSNQIRNYMQGLEDFGSRYMVNSNRYEIAAHIQQNFADIGFSQTSIDDFEVTLNGGSDTTLTQYNVS
ncbi:MAG TPA: hypothetical protein VJ939_01875, partial [Bacteroidales bacterium]|nr:hypothetical protein [Bacteroidales bacterium]